MEVYNNKNSLFESNLEVRHCLSFVRYGNNVIDLSLIHI